MTATVAAPSRGDVMAQAPNENFPVASRVLGSRTRGHLLALYGYARLVDDLGDEVAGDRLAALDWADAELDRIYAGETPEHPVMRALAPTVEACQLPDGPLRRLIAANRRDQEQARYATWAELMDYCDVSAAPVGELVLHVFGAATPGNVARSDRICAGLQVVEHLQDVGEDHARGRVYLPAEDLARFGVADDDLAAPAAGPALRALVAFEAERAAALLAHGAPLARRLSARPRLAVAGFVSGGRAALAALARADFDVLGARPRPAGRTVAAGLLRAAAGR